jgi:hypothetical protein
MKITLGKNSARNNMMIPEESVTTKNDRNGYCINELPVEDNMAANIALKVIP